MEGAAIPFCGRGAFSRELMSLEGDVGARHLLARHGEAVAEVPVMVRARSSIWIRLRHWRRFMRLTAATVERPLVRFRRRAIAA